MALPAVVHQHAHLLPTNKLSWLAKPAYSDACYRVHARVEDCIRTGKTPVSKRWVQPGV